MIKRIFIFLLIVIYPSSLFNGETLMTGKEILEKFYKRTEWKKVEMEIEMTLVNRRGRKRVRNFVVFSKYFGKDLKMFFMFTSPSDVKGIRFLTYDKRDQDDERWLYLPSMKKIQRISGSSRNDYFMGSDLTYYDLTKRDVKKATHKLLNGEQGSPLWIIESIPVKNFDIYEKIVTKIRKKEFVPERIEFFGRNGKLVKVMSSLEIEKVRGIWFVKKLEMKNVIKRHKTILEVKKISFDRKFKDEIFTPSRFSRIRIN